MRSPLSAQQHACPRWTDLLFFYSGRTVNREYKTGTLGTNAASPAYSSPGYLQPNARNLTNNVDAIVEIANSTSFDVPSGDFTIEAWVQFGLTGLEGGGMLSKGWPSITGPFLFYFNNGGANFLSFYSSTNDTAWTVAEEAPIILRSALTYDVWHHVAAVRSGSRVYTYYDGSRTTDVAAGSTGALNANTNAVRIGKTTAGNTPNILLESLAIWRYARYTGSSFSLARVALPRFS